MIDEIRLRNFRGFRDFTVPKLTGVNIIVGDNGVGKTAVLEAVFLALLTTPQNAVRLRALRGLEGTFSGPVTEIIESLYGDLFRGLNVENKIEIDLRGSGPEARSVSIERGRQRGFLPKDATSINQTQTVTPIEFDWVDSDGNHHPVGTKIGPTGIEFESTGESLRNFYYYSANMAVPSGETATFFTNLRKNKRRDRSLTKIFTETFPWIDDLSVESFGGAPVLHASMRDGGAILPLAVVSGAISRIAAILLSIANSQDGIVMVDEIENGIYFKNYQPLIKSILEISREYNCQLLLTTHSNEFLDALGAVVGEEDEEHIALYRLTRGKEQTDLTRVGPSTLFSGLRSSGELR